MTIWTLVFLGICAVMGYLFWKTVQNKKPYWLFLGIAGLFFLFGLNGLIVFFRTAIGFIIVGVILFGAWYLYSVFKKKGMGGVEDVTKQWVDKGTKVAKNAADELKEKFKDIK